MQQSFVDQWITPSIVQAIGWTLLHSLWQGAVAALLALCLLSLTKKSRPAVRHDLLLVLVAAFIISVNITFCFYSITGHTPATTQNIALNKASVIALGNTDSIVIAEQIKSYLDTLENTFNNHINLIVAIWFLICCIQCLRLCVSLGYVYRIRNYKIYPPSAGWLTRCEDLRNVMGIRKKVAFAESGIVKVPLVIGLFKPLILIPAGLLANLPYHQVESILLHELAHIKRRDYLINLFQSLVETIFFFNPAILWICSLIKEEREACCDEMAVQQTESKSQYIQALVSFQEISVNPSGYAMAFPGRRNFLLRRVERIINNENKKLSSVEKMILFLGIIAITAFSVISTENTSKENAAVRPITQALPMRIDTVPKNIASYNTATKKESKRTSTRVTTDDDGKEKIIVLERKSNDKNLKAKLKDDRITELSVNGEKVAKENLVNYEKEVNTILDEEKRQAAIADKLANQQNDKLSKDNEHKQVQTTRPEKNSIIEGSRDEGPKEDQGLITYKSSGNDDSHEQVNAILDILKQAKIIKGKNGTTFKLTATELLVNGLKQSAELHSQLRKDYIYNPGDFYTFTSIENTTDITVHRED